MEQIDDIRVLVAESNPAILSVLTNMLTSWGYLVIPAADGGEAWEILRAEGGPRLAILVSSMNGLQGVDVCRRVRTTAGLNYVYMVILTSRSRSEDLVAAMDAGADDCIGKPFCSQELRARLVAGFRIIRLQERLIQAREELYEQATRDGLTGLWNRKSVMEVVENEIARARRSSSSLAVIMADIDRFKCVNDTLGHFAGDEVLRETARRMKGAIRQYDSVGRYGGEEFLIVVPGCDLFNSLALADRLRYTVAESPMDTSEGRLSISCSFGVAWMDHTSDTTMASLLRGADVALYRAKRHGRNRVESTTIASLVGTGDDVEIAAGLDLA